MGLHLVTSFYDQIPIEDPEEKLCAFSQHIMHEIDKHKKEAMLEELLHESRSRLQYNPKSAAANFGLGMALLEETAQSFYYINKAVTSSYPSIEYAVYALQLFKDKNYPDFFRQRIRSYIEHIIKKAPYHNGAIELAEEFVTDLNMTKEQFNQEVEFARHRLRFQR